jgi:hypothetical protein
MQDKYIDTGDQMIEDLFVEIADDAQDTAVTTASHPVIRIVRFDDSDRPVDSETRPLRSFL